MFWTARSLPMPILKTSPKFVGFEVERTLSLSDSIRVADGHSIVHGSRCTISPTLAAGQEEALVEKGTVEAGQFYRCYSL
jgi:hypothetical protein